MKNYVTVITIALTFFTTSLHAQNNTQITSLPEMISETSQRLDSGLVHILEIKKVIEDEDASHSNTDIEETIVFLKNIKAVLITERESFNIVLDLCKTKEGYKSIFDSEKPKSLSSLQIEEDSQKLNDTYADLISTCDEILAMLK